MSRELKSEQAQTNRRGRGRKPIPDDQVCIRRDYPAFTVRLPPEMYAKLKEKARYEGRSIAVQIERDLRETYG